MGKPRWWSLKPIMVAFRDHPCVCRRASLSCCVLGSNRTLASFMGWDNTSPECVNHCLTHLTMFKAPFIHPGFDRSHLSLSLSLTSKPPSALFSQSQDPAISNGDCMGPSLSFCRWKASSGNNHSTPSYTHMSTFSMLLPHAKPFRICIVCPLNTAIFSLVRAFSPEPGKCSPRNGSFLKVPWRLEMILGP